MHLVDTSVWIEFLRRSGSSEIQKRLNPLIRSGSVAVTEWIILELMTGLRSHDKASTLLEQFAPVYRLSLSDESWDRAWNLAARLRKKGISASAADCLIATIAAQDGATLLHCDSDFELIAPHAKLRTLNWVEYL